MEDFETNNTHLKSSIEETQTHLTKSMLGLKFRNERKRLDLNQIEFGAHCGVTNRAVSCSYIISQKLDWT